MMGLYSSNADLLAALCILAPEGNVRVALVGLIEFLEETAEDIVFDRMAIFEVIAQGVVNGFDPTAWSETVAKESDSFDGKTPEEVLEHWRKQLGTDE